MPAQTQYLARPARWFFLSFLVSGYAGQVCADSSGFTGLEEITVTASKRAESLQDVGMSITALSDTDLERMGAVELLDFAVRVPNLGLAYEADGRFDSSSPSIRGVFGTGTTGFYIDDTPVNASLLPRVMDVQRIEVLRGPQGSLYGARSMGGTIRMITKQPDLTEYSGMLHTELSSVTDGDYNSAIDAAFNLPLIENLFALRVAAYAGQNSGIYDRVYDPTWVEAGSGVVRPNPGPDFGSNNNVDDESFYGVQIVGKWAINDNLTFIPKLIGQRVDADGLPFADIDAENTTQKRFYDIEESGQDKWYLASGTFHWDLAAGAVVSTTSWYERKTDESEEQTTFLHFLFNQVIGVPIDPLASAITTVAEYQNFSHETRFTSDFSDRWRFTLGVFYQDSEYDDQYLPTYQRGLNDAIDTFFGVPGLAADCVNGFCLDPEDLIFVRKTVTTTEEIAAFGEASLDVNEWLTVTLGGRFYQTEVDAANQTAGFANGGPSSFGGDQSESGFNPKILLEASVNDNVNLYTTASKGFRIGGVNGFLPALCDAELATLGVDSAVIASFDSDELWSYELGFKTTFADNRINLNGAVYRIDWTDIQQLNRLACGFSYRENAGEAESTGFELEIMAAPVDGLTLSLGVGYTEAEITDAGGVAGVSKGDKIQGVPDWTVTGGIEYQFDLTRDWTGLLRLDGNYYGDSYSANNESSAASQRLRESWSAVNLRAGMLNETWEVILFADNLTDERANLADSRSVAAETPGRQRLVTNRPRTLGLSLRLRF